MQPTCEQIVNLRKVLCAFLFFFGFSEIGSAQVSTQPYFPTKDRFALINQERCYKLKGQRFCIQPFEMFDVLQFEFLYAGLNLGLRFKLVETNEQFDFLVEDFKDKQECPTYSYYKMSLVEHCDDFDSELQSLCGEITIHLPLDDSYLIRKLVPHKRYKVIYAFYTDSILWRRPYPTEPTDHYYIVDIVEMDGQFERQLE